MSVKLTKAARVVLERLASGGWIMDQSGNDGMSAVMLGSAGVEKRVSAKIVSLLFSEGLIRVCRGDVSDWDITEKGRSILE